MFATLGRFVHRHRRRVALVWLAVFVVGMALGGSVVDRLDTEGRGPDSESERVKQHLANLDHHGGEIVAVIDGAPVDDPHTRREVEAALADVRARPDVESVLDHYSTGSDLLVANDGNASAVLVTLSSELDSSAERDASHEIADRLHAIDVPSVAVGGAVLLQDEYQKTAERDLKRGESAALPIALAAMVVIFGGVAAAALPLLIAFSAVAGATLVLLGAASVMHVSIFAINVVYMLGLGLGIDYGLLIVSRFREERAAGREIAEAVERTVATAGVTVAFSALTVAVALAGLFAFGYPMMSSFGVAGIGVVLLSMASALTLLPALLGMWGRRIRPARARVSDHGFFARLAGLVQRRAGIVVAVVSVLLVLLATPFLSARVENGDARWLPKSSEARAVVTTLTGRFPTRGADPIVVLMRTEAGSAEAKAFERWVRSLPGVAAVLPRTTATPGSTVVDVYPDGPSQSDSAQHLVRTLRDDPRFDVEVGGPAAVLIDMKQSVADRLPYALAIIAAATFVLLFLMTGSIAVPIKAIVMNLLSLGASFGGLVWVFQEGHLSGLLHFESTGALDLSMPILIFIFAFGLSMDYEVFLLSRIKETYDEVHDNDLAVAKGLQRTGRIITSAALLIVVVFAGFTTGEALGIKQLGFGLALAVIVDATIVRSLLVPATMKLLGDWNWWAPRPLRQVHERFGFHEPALGPAHALAVPAFSSVTCQGDEYHHDGVRSATTS